MFQSRVRILTLPPRSRSNWTIASSITRLCGNPDLVILRASLVRSLDKPDDFRGLAWALEGGRTVQVYGCTGPTFVIRNWHRAVASGEADQRAQGTVALHVGQIH